MNECAQQEIKIDGKLKRVQKNTVSSIMSGIGVIELPLEIALRFLANGQQKANDKFY